MDPSAVLVKTPKGLEEVEKRTHKLAGRLRALLFMIDGHRPLSEFLEQAGSLAGQLEAQLNQLAAEGYISELAPPAAPVPEVASTPPRPAPPTDKPPPTPTPRVKPAEPANLSTQDRGGTSATAGVPWMTTPIADHKSKINTMLTETMGMRAMLLSGQLLAVRSHEELEHLIDDIAKSLATTGGSAAGKRWRAQARSLVGLK